MIFSGAPNQIQPLNPYAMPPGVLSSATPAAPNPLQAYGPGFTPGLFSQMAYQMAGSPNQGPRPSVAPPPTQPYTPGGFSSSGGGGGILGTVLGTAAKNPQAVQNLYNAASGALTGTPNILGGASAAPSVSGLFGAPTPVTSIGAPSGDLYSGASGAAGAGPDPGAGQLGSVSDTAPGGDTVQTSSTPDQFGAYTAAAPVAGGLLGGSAPAGAVTITDAATGELLAGGADAGAAGGAAGSAAGGSAGAGIGAGTIAAGAGAGVLAALPVLAEFGLLGDNTLPTGASFVKSIQGSPYFTSAQQQQINQMYGQLGESGFWNWFHQNFPGWDAASRPNARPSVRPP